jgi:hypothetical protein
VEGGGAIKVKGGGTTQELKLVLASLGRMELPDVWCFSSPFFLLCGSVDLAPSDGWRPGGSGALIPRGTLNTPHMLVILQ